MKRIPPKSTVLQQENANQSERNAAVLQSVQQLTKEDPPIEMIPKSVPLPEFAETPRQLLSMKIDWMAKSLEAQGYQKSLRDKIKRLNPELIIQLQESEDRINTQFKEQFPFPDMALPLYQIDEWEKFADTCLSPHYDLYIKIMEEIK